VRHEVLIRTSSGRRSIIIDDGFCQSLSVPIPRDNFDSVSLFIATWIALLADSPLEPENKPFRLYDDFLKKIRLDGIKATVLRFTSLSHELVSNHTLMGPGTSIGSWISDFKDTPVFFEYNRYFKTGDVRLLEYLYTFLNFGKKLDYVDEVFNTTAFRGWMDIEKGLIDQKLHDTDVSALKLIMGVVLPPFVIDDFRPKFGPGSVSEKGVVGRLGKLRQLTYDSYLDRFIFHGHIGMYGSGDDHGLTAHKVIPDPERWTPSNGRSSRVARLMFVPKNLKTARSICMEPNTLMFFQQGIMREMLRLIGNSALSKFIDIADQQRNKDLALFGSYTGEIDTIDLSAASDSLSLQLVKAVFPATWQIVMRASRSHSAYLPDGSTWPLRKFAPMGSALCFPTQCIIFASACIYAACLHTYEAENVQCDFLDWLSPSVVTRVIESFSNQPGYYRGAYQPAAVYGDDICVDSQLTSIVKTILSRLGFTVNDSKSFVANQSFRESCGGFYLDGHDITPLYFTVRGVRQQLSGEHVASHVHLVNECWSRKYKHTYRFLLSSLAKWDVPRRLRSPRNTFSIPFVLDTRQFGILCTKPVNSHLVSRVNASFQRDEIKVWTISYEYRVSDDREKWSLDAYEHMRWWSGRTESSSNDEKSSFSRFDTGGAGIRWRWIPSD